MKVLIATDVTIFIHENRILANGKHSLILRRYFQNFGRITLYARFAKINHEELGFDDITEIVESRLEIHSLNSVLLGKDNARIQDAMKDCDLVICRCPAISAYRASDIARKLNIPYLAESMGDPWDAYWNHGLQGKCIAAYMYLKMKEVVWNADYAVYVTTEYLQNRYPCQNKSIAASNVLIEESNDRILEKRKAKIRSFDSHNIALMTTAAIDVRYKGQQYVIKSIPELNRAGIRVLYRIVGEGNKGYLEGVAKEYGVLDQVAFLGRLPLSQVFELLDETDIYLQPSLQEGLPRSVIEAMSRGCACIGAKTAGIPELLEKDMVVKRKSVKEIADRIRGYSLLSEQERMSISVNNYTEAKKYSKDNLDAKRNAYYDLIKQSIENEGDL